MKASSAEDERTKSRSNLRNSELRPVSGGSAHKNISSLVVPDKKSTLRKLFLSEPDFKYTIFKLILPILSIYFWPVFVCVSKYCNPVFLSVQCGL